MLLYNIDLNKKSFLNKDPYYVHEKPILEFTSIDAMERYFTTKHVEEVKIFWEDELSKKDNDFYIYGISDDIIEGIFTYNECSIVRIAVQYDDKLVYKYYKLVLE